MNYHINWWKPDFWTINSIPQDLWLYHGNFEFAEFMVAIQEFFHQLYCRSTISTLLHDKINPKDCQVLSFGDSGFLQLFRVVSSDYGKPRINEASLFGICTFLIPSPWPCCPSSISSLNFWMIQIFTPPENSQLEPKNVDRWMEDDFPFQLGDFGGFSRYPP